MRVVLQRVTEASVSIDGRVHSAICRGLVVLVGVEEADTAEDIEWLATKIANLRIFDDEAGAMNLSVVDVLGELLVVSQFTLHASTKKGTRPSWHRAAKPEQAIPLYEAFCVRLMAVSGRPMKTGVFGANMQVSLVNDGPVTLCIDSKTRE